MKFLIEPANLNLPFVSNLKLKTKEAKEILHKLKAEYDKLSLNSSNNEIIPTGSRVLIKYENGETKEGRVWGYKKYTGEYSVNRDGYKATMNFKAESLTNLSVGYYGKLEREIWLFEDRIAEYEKILNNTELPEILTKHRFNIIEVVKVESDTLSNYISFILAKNLRSARFKLPKNIITTEGFFEVEVVNNEIVSVERSSRLAFEKSAT